MAGNVLGPRVPRDEVVEKALVTRMRSQWVAKIQADLRVAKWRRQASFSLGLPISTLLEEIQLVTKNLQYVPVVARHKELHSGQFCVQTDRNEVTQGTGLGDHKRGGR